MHLSEHLARALAKYQESEPWENLPKDRQEKHQRLGSLLALELAKMAQAAPTNTPATASGAPSLSHAAAVEVCVEVPLMVGGKTVALIPKVVQDIYASCLRWAVAMPDVQGGKHGG